MTKIAVIGCGQWGPNHIRNFHQLPHSTVLRAIDTDEERRRAMAELYPSVEVGARAEDALGDDRVDAVVIATPTDTHYELATAALEAGKHVLCEKPLCETADEGRSLTELARERDRVLMVGHVFLFNPGILRLKELLRTDALGRLHYMAMIRTNLGPIRSDVNAVYDLASHDLSIFNFLLESRPVEVSAVGAGYVRAEIEDVAFVSLRYPSDVLANVRVSWLDPRKVRELTVVGHRKMALWNDLGEMGPLTIFDKGVEWQPTYYESYGEFRLLTRQGDVEIPNVPAEEPLKLQARHFLDVVAGEAKNRSDGAFSADIVRVLEAINESLEGRGAPVELAWPDPA